MNQTYSPDQLLYGPPPRDCVLGDMNLDGEIDVRDLSALKKVILSTEEHKYQLRDYGDPDGDGFVLAAGACRSVACRTGFTAEENRRHLSGMKPRQIGEHKKFTIIVSTLS